MRMILMALALGISVAAVASPALAEPDGNKTDLGTIDQFLGRSDRDTPQISVAWSLVPTSFSPCPLYKSSGMRTKKDGSNRPRGAPAAGDYYSLLPAGGASGDRGRYEPIF